MTCPVCGNEAITIYENGGQYACCFRCGHREETMKHEHDKPTCDLCACKLRPLGNSRWICPECQEVFVIPDSKDHIDPQLKKELAR